MTNKPTKTVSAKSTKAKPSPVTVRGQTEHALNVDDLPFIRSDKLEFQVVKNEVSPSQLKKYKSLYLKAKESDEKFVIFATPKLRSELITLSHTTANKWLGDITIRNYPNNESLANNVARGMIRTHAVFMAETGRYHEIIAKSFSVVGGEAIFVSNAGVGRGITTPVVYKPSDIRNLKIDEAVKAFKEKYGTTATKKQIDAFIKEMTASFNNYLSEVLWEEGVYGQSEKHVEVYKGPAIVIPKYKK